MWKCLEERNRRVCRSMLSSCCDEYENVIDAEAEFEIEGKEKRGNGVCW